MLSVRRFVVVVIDAGVTGERDITQDWRRPGLGEHRQGEQAGSNIFLNHTPHYKYLRVSCVSNFS